MDNFNAGTTGYIDSFTDYKGQHGLSSGDQGKLAQYGNTGCGVFKGRIQNYIGFWLKINCRQTTLSKGLFEQAMTE